MMLDRIERHDVINAVLLAGLLLLLGFGIISAVGSFFSTMDSGVVSASKSEDEDEVNIAPAGATVSTPVVTEPPSTTTLPPARPPSEVTVRVANGARRPGVAGAGTEALTAAGYPALSPKNGPTMDNSVVYYTNGFAAEAAAAAVALGLEPTQIEPLPADPGVAVDGADLLVILGVSSPF